MSFLGCSRRSRPNATAYSCIAIDTLVWLAPTVLWCDRGPIGNGADDRLSTVW